MLPLYYDLNVREFYYTYTVIYMQQAHVSTLVFRLNVAFDSTRFHSRFTDAHNICFE